MEQTIFIRPDPLHSWYASFIVCQTLRMWISAFEKCQDTFDRVLALRSLVYFQQPAKKKQLPDNKEYTKQHAFYDILMTLRDEYNFEYGTDKKIDGIVINDKCKSLARKIKEIIDTKSSFADWLNNQIIRDQLKFDIKVCLIKNGYPPQYSPEVFRKVMEQVENFEENN